MLDPRLNISISFFANLIYQQKNCISSNTLDPIYYRACYLENLEIMVYINTHFKWPAISHALSLNMFDLCTLSIESNKYDSANYLFQRFDEHTKMLIIDKCGFLGIYNLPFSLQEVVVIDS